MNINREQQGSAQGFSPFFNAQASPYLSPLFGTNSHRQPSSLDDFTEFRLEESAYDPALPEQIFPAELDNQDLLLLTLPAPPPPSPIVEHSDHEKQEIMTPAFVPKPNSSPIFSIVCFLVANDDLPEQQILALGKPLYQNCSNYENIFRTLLIKFKKLRKTKEEMIKFCMRKAFKFSSDCKKSARARGKKSGEKSGPCLEMPFRKNSAEKTMNSQFLRQVFSSEEFLVDYRKFLGHLVEIIEEDNSSKIEYLSDTIEKMEAKGELAELEGIKRLPWTRTILKRTEALAKSLIEDFGPDSLEQNAGPQSIQNQQN